MSQKEKEAPKKGKGHHFPNHLFINMDQEEVDEIPPEINGKKLYKIKTTKNKFCDDTRDERYIVMRNSSKNTFPGITKTEYCQDIYVCPNMKCPCMDFSTGKLHNQMHWKTFLGDGNKKACEMHVIIIQF